MRSWGARSVFMFLGRQAYKGVRPDDDVITCDTEPVLRNPHQIMRGEDVTMMSRSRTSFYACARG